jgi:hypothetical protein
VLIRIVKRQDGGGVLRCIRQDGSETWQKQTSRHAAHFSLHDLTHFAVETSLGFRRGFFGLVAEGWDIEDTTGKGSRGALPPEAAEVEHLVGALDTERAGGTLWTTQEFNQSARVSAGLAGRPAPRELSPEQLSRVRALRARLFEDWAAVAPGGWLELRYGPESGTPVSGGGKDATRSTRPRARNGRRAQGRRS